MLAKEECGVAVKCLTEAKTKFLKCGEICATYKSTAGAGHTVRPDEAIFFINYGKELKRSLEAGIFNFVPKLDFLNKISIFEQNWIFKNKISIFEQNWIFFNKISIF